MGGHGKAHNKLYVTAKEWSEQFGGKRDGEVVAKARVPFDCCSLSLQPFRDPVISPDNIVFDILYADLTAIYLQVSFFVGTSFPTFASLSAIQSLVHL